MQKRTALLILALAVFFGFLASISMYHFLQEQRKPEAQEAKIIDQPVVIASKNLQAGDKITEGDVKTEYWPITKIPRNSFADEKETIDRMVRVEIQKGKVIYTEDLLPKETIIEDIPEGMRAMPLIIEAFIGDETTFISGAFIDILATFRDSEGETLSKLILQDIKLLAVPYITERRRNRRTVVVAVKPEDAEALALAQDKGSIYLITRNLTDKGNIMTTGRELSDLKRMATEDMSFIKSIPEGKRAMSIWTLNSFTTEEFLKKGNKADVLVTFDSADKKRITQTILQNVEILAIRPHRGIHIAPDSLKIRGGATEIVLAVEPKDAEKLAIALAKGDISVLPRAIEDNATHPLGIGTAEEEAFKIEDTVEVIRAGVKDKEVLSLPNGSADN